MLRSTRDLQSLAYLAGAPALALWQWRFGFSPWLYAPMVVMWIGVGVIHHNHAHLPMWWHGGLNRASDLWMSALQGHPTFVFRPAHNNNHHRHRHGPRDLARTYRFRGGDTNTLWGYLVHPFQAACVLYPLFLRYLRRLRAACPGEFRWAWVQYVAVLSVWAVAAAASPQKWLLYVLVPQVLGLHWLLGANYFQHAHADGASRWNYARNFEGGVNLVYFNIGLHTAHHEHPGVHWSQLPARHAALRDRVDPRLCERGLVAYVLRVYLGGLLSRRWRSQSLQHPSLSH